MTRDWYAELEDRSSIVGDAVAERECFGSPRRHRRTWRDVKAEQDARLARDPHAPARLLALIDSIIEEKLRRDGEVPDETREAA